MRNQKDIQRKIYQLFDLMNDNVEGGTINLTGNINRFTVGAKTIFACKLKYFNADRDHYKRRIEEVLTANYLFTENPIPFDTLGYWVNNDEIFVDLGFRFSDFNDAIKFGSFNNEIAIWDNREGKEINVNNYLYGNK